MTNRARPLAVATLAMLISTAAYANDWTLIESESHLTFTGTQAGASFDGRFERFEAAIHFAPDALDSSNILITIDMASANTDSADRDTTLPGPDWFDTANHPTATFASTHVTGTDTGYEALGTLTLKGTAKDVTLPFTVAIEGDKAHAQGAVTINRDEFNVGTGPLSPMAGTDVTIRFDINATR